MKKISKKNILMVVILLLIFCSPSLTFSSDYPMINVSFNDVYPKPFLETKTGKGIVVATTVVVASMYSYFFAQPAGTGGVMLATTPATVKIIATQIRLLAGCGSGETTAGLPIAGTGLGMGGEVLVIGTITSIGTGVIVDIAIDQAVSSIKKEPYKRFEYLKLPLIEKGSKDVVKLVKQIKEAEEDFFKGKISLNQYRFFIEQEYAPLLKKRLESMSSSITTKEAAYDLVNRAMLYFNTGKYKLSERDFNAVLAYSEKSSFVLYGLALNNLINNKYSEAIIKLEQCSIQEPEALQPYVLNIMALKDNKRYQEAILLAKSGLNNVGKNFALAWEAGEISYFHLKNYKYAANYFEIAYDKVGEDVVEAEAAIMVALSYKKMTDNEQAMKWYKKALKKAEKNADQIQKIERMWKNV
jgi:tetratricopeptide (TPR) repeat protein